MSEERITALAAQSARVRNESLLLLQGLKAFEKRVLELVAGLNVGGNSTTVTFDEILDLEGEPIGHTACYLAFTSTKLMVGWKQVPRPSEDDYWSLSSLEMAELEMLRLLSAPTILDSLIEDIGNNLQGIFEKTAPVVESLNQYLAIEKTEIDSDLDALFSDNTKLLASWLKARKTVQTDPELCITLSCSHAETVLKGCLKSLGETGYHKDALERLASKVLDKLKKSSVIDEATSQMMKGVATFFLGIATIRNAKSASHGKDEGYTPPSADLAQTVNHLAGVTSVFVMKQTSMHLKNK